MQSTRSLLQQEAWNMNWECPMVSRKRLLYWCVRQQLAKVFHRSSSSKVLVAKYQMVFRKVLHEEPCLREVWLDQERSIFCILPECPILLLVDGHKVHVTVKLIETATANKVLVFCFPLPSLHLLQPLDLSLFGPLKRGWVRTCAAFSHITCAVINQFNFAKIFNVAWSSSTTPDVIRKGFQRCGIYPCDPCLWLQQVISCELCLIMKYERKNDLIVFIIFLQLYRFET